MRSDSRPCFQKMAAQEEIFPEAEGRDDGADEMQQDFYKQQQVFEERQSAMAAQEEIFPKREQEMMERMKMQQDLYQQQQA